MAYNQNTPLGNQLPSITQPQILGNFQSIQTMLNVNHVNFDLPDQGKHKWVSYPIQSSSVATLSTEVATYAFVDSDTTVAELTFRRPSNGVIIPMTATAGTVNGWTMLPSGILMKWATSSYTGLNTVNANSFGKAFSVLYSVQLTNNNATSSSNTYVMGGVISGTNFNVYVGNRTTPGTDATTNVNWLAIGVP